MKFSPLPLPLLVFSSLSYTPAANVDTRAQGDDINELMQEINYVEIEVLGMEGTLPEDDYVERINALNFIGSENDNLSQVLIENEEAEIEKMKQGFTIPNDSWFDRTNDGLWPYPRGTGKKAFVMSVSVGGFVLMSGTRINLQGKFNFSNGKRASCNAKWDMSSLIDFSSIGAATCAGSIIIPEYKIPALLNSKKAEVRAVAYYGGGVNVVLSGGGYTFYGNGVCGGVAVKGLSTGESYFEIMKPNTKHFCEVY